MRKKYMCSRCLKRFKANEVYENWLGKDRVHRCFECSKKSIRSGYK